MATTTKKKKEEEQTKVVNNRGTNNSSVISAPKSSPLDMTKDQFDSKVAVKKANYETQRAKRESSDLATRNQANAQYNMQGMADSDLSALSSARRQRNTYNQNLDIAEAAGIQDADMSIFDTAKKKYNLTDDELDKIINEYDYQMTQKGGEQTHNKYVQYAKEHPGLASAGSVAAKLGGSVLGVPELLMSASDTAKGKRLSQYEGARELLDMSNALREGASSDMSGVGSTVYNTGMGVADMITESALAKGMGISSAMLMAANTANEGVSSALDRGISNGKALGYGAATGVVDYGLTKFGLDKILGSREGSTLLKQMGKGATIEALENAVQRLSETGLDRAINKDNSYWDMAYNSVYDSAYANKYNEQIQKGATEEIADRKAKISANQEAKAYANEQMWKEVGQSAAMGGLFGAAFGGMNYKPNNGMNPLGLEVNGSNLGEGAKAETSASDIPELSFPKGYGEGEVRNDIEGSYRTLPVIEKSTNDSNQANAMLNLIDENNKELVKDPSDLDKFMFGLRKKFLEQEAEKNGVVKDTRTDEELLDDFGYTSYEPNLEDPRKTTISKSDAKSLNKQLDSDLEVNGKIIADKNAELDKIDREYKKAREKANSDNKRTRNNARAKMRELSAKYTELSDETDALAEDMSSRYTSLPMLKDTESLAQEYASKSNKPKEKTKPSNVKPDITKAQLETLLNGNNGELPQIKSTPKANVESNVPSMENATTTTAKPTKRVTQKVGNNAESLAEVGNGVRTNDPYTSQHYETMKNSQMFQSAENQAMLEKAKKSGAFDKTVENRKNSMAAALREYTSNPDKVTDEVLNGEWVNGGLDVDKSALVINNALNNGDTAMVNLAARREAMKLTNAGRELRAVQDNYVATAEGTIVNGTQFMMKEADKLLNKGGKVATEIKSLAEDAVKSGDATKIAKRFSMNDADFKAIQEALGNGADTEEIAKMIAMHNRLGTTQISDETISSIKQIYDEIEKLGLGVNSKQRAELEADAYKLLAKEIGGNSSLKQKWDAWRYLAMLGNPKTHIRNVLGNTTQYMVTEVKDNVAGAIEGVVDKTSRALGGSGIERQKAILNRASKSDNLLVKLARSDADNEAYRALNEMGSKYNDVSDMMSKNRDAFSTKFMNFLNDKNGNLLEGEDYFGLKNKYSKSLARYLKANGADASIFKATDDNSKALLQKAREYAVDQAKQATFHEYSVMADWLSKTSQNLRYGEKANTFSKLGGAMIESLVPFKKTPVNVLKQGVKYSPISLAKAVTTDAYKLSKGLISASDMIEDLAAGMTGTGILALGYFLSQQGYLSGKGSDEYDVNSAEKRQGKQEYAITIGDKSYTLDWLAPFSLPLFVGTELFNQFENEEYQNENGLDKILSAIQTIGEPVTEMSMLQGINDALEQLSYSKSSALGTLGGNLATGYITQGVPTLFGQVARSVDDTRRSTYSDQESGFKKQAERAALKSLNKIPGLSTTNEEYRNEWGETEENTGGSVLGRLAYNMFSPGYYADSSRMTDADTELQRLYESTGESAYSDTLSGSITDIGKLDRQTYTEYQKQYGQNNKALVDSLMANSNYDRLDDSEKVDMINNAYKISKAIVDYEIGGKAINKNNQKYYDAYKKDGIKGITDALINNRNATIEKAAKTAQNEKNSQLAMQYGFTKTDDEGNVTGNYSAYEKAKSVYGNDTVGLSQYGNISTQMVNTTGAQITDGFKYSVPYLFAQENMTDEQKGMSLAASKGGIDALSEEAKKMFESDGYSGLYYYYLKKNITGLDKNKDGVISKDEWQKNYDMDKISREFETYLSQFYDMRIQ